MKLASCVRVSRRLCRNLHGSGPENAKAKRRTSQFQELLSQGKPMIAVQNASSAIANLSEVVAAQIAAGKMPGAQLVVARHGETLLDVALGNTGGDKSTPVTPETLYYSWSVAKPITAIAVHQLIERGKLVLDTPVDSVWPEF